MNKKSLAAILFLLMLPFAVFASMFAAVHGQAVALVQAAWIIAAIWVAEWALGKIDFDNAVLPAQLSLKIEGLLVFVGVGAVLLISAWGSVECVLFGAWATAGHMTFRRVSKHIRSRI